MNHLSIEDLELLTDTANRFYTEKSPISAMRQLRDEEDSTGFDRSLWREMAEMGWAGILLDETHNGTNLGYRALGVILEQSGRTLAASPFLSTVLLGGQVLARADISSQHDEILSSVASGKIILSLAHEESSRHTPSTIDTSAKVENDDFILNGKKVFVLDGHIADYLIVVARIESADETETSMSLFLVNSNTNGVMRKRTVLVDGRSAANIEFHNAEATLIGTAGKGYEVLEPVLDGGRAAIAAEMLGTGAEAFERTIEYLKVREQFGEKLGAFQALKHRAAQMYCEIELARSAVYGALEAVDNGDPETPQLCSIAKAKACEMLELVSNEALQMHGGIGMTDASDIGLFLKRARVAQQILGDALYHRERFAKLVGL